MPEEVALSAVLYHRRPTLKVGRTGPLVISLRLCFPVMEAFLYCSNFRRIYFDWLTTFNCSGKTRQIHLQAPGSAEVISILTSPPVCKIMIKNIMFIFCCLIKTVDC